MLAVQCAASASEDSQSLTERLHWVEIEHLHKHNTSVKDYSPMWYYST